MKNFNEEEKAVIALEVKQSIDTALETKRKIENSENKEEIIKDEECINIEEIDEYIDMRKNILQKLKLPYYKLKVQQIFTE